MAVAGGVNGRGVRARVAFLPECLGVCEGARRTQNRILNAVVCVYVWYKMCMTFHGDDLPACGGAYIYV